jgi:hypothetical protein
MRKALVVGIDYYANANPLYGCVGDAYKVNSVLESNSDGTRNFDVMLITGTGPKNEVLRSDLRKQINELFSGENEIALFYFSGHGYIENTGGYIIASDSQSGDDGIPLSDIIIWASKSKSNNRIIILDSCFSGIAGSNPIQPSQSEISEGVTILTASTSEEYALEENGSGVFTSLLVDALSGAAGNLVGDVSPGSIYAHIDQSLGPWSQRPIFKTNVKNFVSLRKVQPPISLADLQRIVELFPSQGFEYKLDPSFEPEREIQISDAPAPNPKNTEIFSILQKYNRVNLLIPVGAPHMWHAAINSKSCKLTVLGEHYRRLVENKRI